MISSRWPRPTFVIASIGLMPVSIGSFTGWRCTTPGRLELGRPRLGRCSMSPLPSSGLPSGSTMRPSSASPTGHLEQAAGALDLVALLDLVPLAEQHGADVVGLEVEREAGHVVRQLEQLERHAVVEPVDARDAVGDRQDRADLGQVGAAVLEPLDALLEDAGDLVWLDLHCRRLLRGLRRPWPLAFVTCSSLLRTLASSTMLPTRTTRPPSTSGSTLLDSSTRRPVCSSISLADVLDDAPRRARRRSSRVTGSSLFSSAHSASKSRRMRNSAGIRWRSASSSRKLTRRSSASLTIRPIAVLLLLRREVGREEEDLQVAVARRARRRTGRARRARGRGRRSPWRPRTAHASRPRRSLPSSCPAPLPRPASVGEVDLLQRVLDQPAVVLGVERLARDLLGGDDREVGDLLADLVERAPGLRLDVAPGGGHQLLALLGGVRLGARPASESAALRARTMMSSACSRASLQAGAVLLEQLVGLLLGALAASSIDSSIACRRLSSASAMRGKASLLSR